MLLLTNTRQVLLIKLDQMHDNTLRHCYNLWRQPLSEMRANCCKARSVLRPGGLYLLEHLALLWLQLARDHGWHSRQRLHRSDPNAKHVYSLQLPMCADIKELQTALFTSKSCDMTNMTHHRSYVEWSWAVQIDWPLTWLALLHSKHHIEFTPKRTLDLSSIYNSSHMMMTQCCRITLQEPTKKQHEERKRKTWKNQAFAIERDNESLCEHKQPGVAAQDAARFAAS